MIKKNWPTILTTVLGAICTGLASAGYIPADVAGSMGTGFAAIITAIAHRMQAPK